MGGGTILSEDDLDEGDKLEYILLYISKMIFRNRKNLNIYSRYLAGFGALVTFGLFAGMIILSSYFPDLYMTLFSQTVNSIWIVLFIIGLISIGLSSVIKKSFCKNCGTYLNFRYQKTHRTRMLKEGHVIDHYKRFYKCGNCGHVDTTDINRIVSPGIDEIVEF